MLVIEAVDECLLSTAFDVSTATILTKFLSMVKKKEQIQASNNDGTMNV